MGRAVYLIGPYNAGPYWRYFLAGGGIRAGVNKGRRKKGPKNKKNQSKVALIFLMFVLNIQA